MNHRLRYLPYPPTSLPVRDLFVLDYVSYGPETRLLEIGIGSGETSARIAMECREVAGVDIAGPVVKSLGYLKQRFPNLELICADVTSDTGIGKVFDVILSCDTLEHVGDPERFFRFIAEHLAKGGKAHVLFPNEVPPETHGITHFKSEDDLRSAAEAHFTQMEIFRVDLCPWPKLIVAMSFGWVQKLCRSKGGVGAKRAQRFDETRFFKRQKLWRRLSPVINLYWFLMLFLCRLGGKVYELKPVGPQDFSKNCNLYIRLS